MGKKNTDAADDQPDKAGGIDPVGDADEDRMPGSIRDGRILDCEAWKGIQTERNLARCESGRQ
jgi:hypothetical protein